MSSPSRDSAATSVNRVGSAERAVKESSVTLNYPMLTKTNFSVWSLKMRVNLQAQGVWEAIEVDEEEEVDRRKDRMALAAIYQAVPEDILLAIAEKDSAKQAWDTLRTMQLGAERVREAKVQTLKSDFELLRMRDTETVDDFSMKLTTIVTSIRSMGEKVDETSVVMKFLRALPKKYVQLASTIEQFVDLKTLTMEEVIGRLKVHEERLRSYGDREDDKGQLLLTREEWKAREKKSVGAECSSSRGKNRGHEDNRGGGRGDGHNVENF